MLCSIVLVLVLSICMQNSNTSLGDKRFVQKMRVIRVIGSQLEPTVQLLLRSQDCSSLAIKYSESDIINGLSLLLELHWCSRCVLSVRLCSVVFRSHVGHHKAMNGTLRQFSLCSVRLWATLCSTLSELSETTVGATDLCRCVLRTDHKSVTISDRL